MIFLRSLLTALFVFFGSLYLQSQEIVEAAAFGVRANSYGNAAEGLRKAIAACKGKEQAVLVLPGGRIDVWPEDAEKRELYISNCTESDSLSKVKNIAMLFDGCQNITVDGRNTLVMLHGKMVSFALLNSQDITIRDVSFDYERPTMSELSITAVSGNTVEAQIHPDSRYGIDNGRIFFYGEGWKTGNYHTILFEPDEDQLRYSTFAPFAAARATDISPFKVRFEGDFSKSSFRPGQVLTMRDPYRDNCGAFISLSRNIRLESVNMHFMHGLGIVSQFSENISFFKVMVEPRKNSGRVIASFADCFHFSGCRGKIEIDSCATSGSHDDPVNVHGTHLQITQVTQGKMIVRFMHHQTYGFPAFYADDSISFIDPVTLLPQGKARLSSAKLVTKHEMELEVNGTLPPSARTGMCIENLTWTPEVVIRNSRFARTNTRGLLITTRRKVIIENNTFHHTGMFPILIANDASSWFESGSVHDVTISNNIFEGCGYNSGNGAVHIAPENKRFSRDSAVHHNIRITGNRFVAAGFPVLYAKSVKGIVFSGNKIMPLNQTGFGGGRDAAKLDHCSKVTIVKNEFAMPALPAVQLTGMPKKSIETDLPVLLNK